MGRYCLVPILLVFVFVTLYEQTQARRVIICQGSTRTLKCPRNRVIRLRAASYGRGNLTLCRRARDGGRRSKCGRNNNALPLVRQKCNAKTSCVLQATSSIYTFNDQCRRGSAYLRVQYRCVKGCSKQQFQCQTSLKCIPKIRECDEKKHCNDGSDEARCKCEINQFQCKTSRKCISQTLVCNDKNDCNDGSDEKGCATASTCGMQEIQPVFERPSCPLPSLKIVGGCAAIANSWPWAIQLRVDDLGTNNYIHECGAALISPQYALTASHCFLFVDDPAKWQAVAGRHSKEGTEANQQIRQISNIIKFPNPSSNILDRDMTLLKFDQPMVMNRYVSPVCLPTREPKTDDYCAVVGWGETRNTGSADILKQSLMPIVDRQTCNNTQGFIGDITPHMVCSGWEEGKNDACQGDSGGPLMCRNGNTYYLQGTVSWGNDCAQPAQPGVYGNVFKIVDWIKNQMLIT